jgi:hypothetical protein
MGITAAFRLHFLSITRPLQAFQGEGVAPHGRPKYARIIIGNRPRDRSPNKSFLAPGVGTYFLSLSLANICLDDEPATEEIWPSL